MIQSSGCKNVRKKRQGLGNSPFLLVAGFTLIELLVALAVVVLVLTAVVAGVAFSVKNTRFSKEKSLSTRHGQEAIEWLRGYRDQLGWSQFYALIDEDAGGSRVVYCLPSLVTTTAGFQALSSVVGCSEGEEVVGTVYTREMQLDLVSVDQIDVVVRVYWEEGGDVKTSTQRTIFRNW